MAGRFALTGKKCLVTGGTKGIGRAILNEFVGLGAQVFICARSNADVAATISELQQLGHTVRGCATDLTDPQQRQHLLEEVTEFFDGELHVLVCNAGVNAQHPTLDYTSQDYQTIVGTNLESTFFLCQLMQPLLAKAAAAPPPPALQLAPGSSPGPPGRAEAAVPTASGARPSGDASIIFVSSVAGGPLAGRSGSLYAISKAGVNQLAASLGCEWAKLGIRVNSVAPWVTLTELGKQNLQDPAVADRLLSRTPLGRLAQPEDVSGVVAFLAGPAAAYITGQTIPVDGGYSKMGMW